MRLFDVCIENRLRDSGIRPQDVIEKFVRSRAPGGQHVNKTSSCVYLKHLPTGIEVKSQEERSQSLNRRRAWSMLIDKICDRRRQEFARARDMRERMRRQKRRRSFVSKQLSIEYKRRLSRKKKMRMVLRNAQQE